MNNEPVAWMKKQYSPDIGEWVDYREDELVDYTPLYTHPHSEESVKEKTLTDEEIEKVWYEECSSSDSLIEFARAILRKAQGEDRE